MSDFNELGLPTNLYVQICEDLEIAPNLDVCASKENRKCDQYFSREDNALEKDWVALNEPETVVYCNPPMIYDGSGNTGKRNFLRKAHHEWKERGITILFIMTSDAYTSQYFWDYALRYNAAYGDKCVEIKPLKRRPVLVKPDGKMGGVASKGLFVVVFRKWCGEPVDDSRRRAVCCVMT